MCRHQTIWHEAVAIAATGPFAADLHSSIIPSVTRVVSLLGLLIPQQLREAALAGLAAVRTDAVLVDVGRNADRVVLMTLELIAAFLIVFVLSDAHRHLCSVHRDGMVLLSLDSEAALRDWPLHLSHVLNLIGRRALALHEPHPFVLQRCAVTVGPLIADI